MSAFASRLSLRSCVASCLGLAVLGSIVAAPSEARASGYLTARFGADHGTPVQPNTFAVYFNPAALGGTKGTTITGDASVLLRFAQYTRTGDALSPSNESSLSDPSYVSANTGKANLTNLLALPFLGVNTDFGTENLRAGYAAYIPFGGLATWDRVKGVPGVPGSTDGVQRWHNISGQILAIYNTFAVAYRFHPRFSVGASVSPVIHHVATVRARNSDGSDDTLRASGELVEGRSYLDATGINVAASLGVYVEPTDDLRLGLAYLAQPGFGETRMSGTLQTKLGSNPQTKEDIDFLQTYPDIIRFGADWRADKRLVLRGDFEFVRWSVFDRQCVVKPGETCNVASDGRDLSGGKVILNVPRNWDNAIGVRVGPGYWLNERTELFGSLGFTTPAVPKETIDASTVDSQRLYATVGARYEFSKHVALAGSYNHIYFFNVNTNGQNDQNIAAHPANQPGGGDYNASRSPSADGRYRSQIGFVNVNVAYTF
jgi:long-chain fatty acid transport protein